MNSEGLDNELFQKLLNEFQTLRADIKKDLAHQFDDIKKALAHQFDPIIAVLREGGYNPPDLGAK